MKRLLLPLLLALLPCLLAAAPAGWGDQGDGTFRNPVLNSDYSDPDVIRVGESYYMVCSDFHFLGMPVLKSEDMVNWRIIGQVYSRFDFPGWNENKHYAGGSWAPALRYHDGKFWVFFCTLSEGLFMSNATDPAGPWSPLVCLKAVEKWEDPCPFWDEDGQAYLGRSQWGAGPIILHRMSPDGTRLLDEGTTIYTGPVAEGTKFYRKDGYYYLSIPEGGVPIGWQTVLRAKNLYGPWERKVVLEQGRTAINGPHQGALVDTPSGEWWFYHYQMTEPLGRVVHLQPVRWVDGWPVIGVDLDGNGIGEPVERCAKPATGKQGPLLYPQTNDSLAGPALGLQWQFNHNPADEAWSLQHNKGWLTLTGLKASVLRDARNMITQKMTGDAGECTVELDFARLAEGQRAGLSCLGDLFNAIGITKLGGRPLLYLEKNGVVETLGPVRGTRVHLRATLDAKANRHQLAWSADGKAFEPVGTPYSLKLGDWKGARLGLYSYTVGEETGQALFRHFTYTFR